MNGQNQYKKKLSEIPISILDLAAILAGKTPADTFKNSADLAQHAEEWGYKRYWLAEHHSMESIASSATSVLIGFIAGKTSTIRVGSGGIMLPNHSPLVIAEQFGTLESLYPGRIDLGIGRAPGSDQVTARALRRNLHEGANDFPESLMELRQYLSLENNSAIVRAIPGEGLKIPIWLLGSSTYSAQLAAILGLPFAFASHFAPTYLEAALKMYRSTFKASANVKLPYAMACVNVIAAETDGEAEYLATSLYQLATGIIRSTSRPLQQPVSNMDEIWSDYEKAAISQMMRYTFIGSSRTVKRKLQVFLSETSVDEVMITSHIYDHKARVNSYKIIADLVKEERFTGEVNAVFNLFSIYLSNKRSCMKFELTEEHLMIQQAARDFAQNECLPGVIERDEQQKFPKEQIIKLAQLGFMGMMVSTEYGGSGMDTISYVLAMEEISKIDASVSVCMSVNNSLVCWGIEAFGTEEQKKKYLTHLATGSKDGELFIGAFLLSEPGAGSDATSQQTMAEDKGDYYLLNGTKNWITNGSTASVYLVMAQTHPEVKSHGINTLIVENNWPGVTIGTKENKLGIRGSDTTSIMFTDVKVPKENRIGDEGFGFTFAMKTLAGGRIGIASQALGIASGAYELALNYAKERKAFGKEIMHHQAIQFKLADMATKISAARLLCLKAAWEKDNHKDYTYSSSMAKVYSSETAMWTAIEAVQIHGGYGFVKEYHIERLMRDAKITQIYEGTSEVQRIVISRALLH